MVDNLDQHQWSSHQNYTQHKNEAWLTTDLISSLLQSYTGKQQGEYDCFMEQYAMSDRDFDYVKEGGSQHFIEVDLVSNNPNEVTNVNLAHLKIGEIIDITCRFLKIDRDLISQLTLSDNIVRARVHQYI